MRTATPVEDSQPTCDRIRKACAYALAGPPYSLGFSSFHHSRISWFVSMRPFQLPRRGQMLAGSLPRHNRNAPPVSSPGGSMNPSTANNAEEDDKNEEGTAPSYTSTCCMTEVGVSERPAKITWRRAQRVFDAASWSSSCSSDNKDSVPKKGGLFESCPLSRHFPVSRTDLLSPSVALRRSGLSPRCGDRLGRMLRFFASPPRLPILVLVIFFLINILSSFFSSLLNRFASSSHPLSAVPNAAAVTPPATFSEGFFLFSFFLVSVEGKTSLFPFWIAEAVYVPPIGRSLDCLLPGVLPLSRVKQQDDFRELFSGSSSFFPSSTNVLTSFSPPHQTRQSLCSTPSTLSSKDDASLSRPSSLLHRASRYMPYLSSVLPSRNAHVDKWENLSQPRICERELRGGVRSSIPGFLNFHSFLRERCLPSTAVDSRRVSSLFLSSQLLYPTEPSAYQRLGGSLAKPPGPPSPMKSFRPSSSLSDATTSSLFSTNEASNQHTSSISSSTSSSPSSSVPRYCMSVSSTQRLPTRTVVIGRGEKAAAYHEFYFSSSASSKSSSSSSPSSILPPGSWREGFPVLLGGSHPLVLQTMVNSDTRDVDATVEQIRKCAEAGAHLVRMTVQGMKEVEASKSIKEKLDKMNLHIPLVADIHFQPKVALACAEIFEKVRVNPGNFADGAKRWEDDDEDSDKDKAKRRLSTTIASQKKHQEQGREGEDQHDMQAVLQGENEQEEEKEAEEIRKRDEDKRRFDEGHKRIEELLVPLIEKCKELKTAMRIGTNHGSLSARILRQYGDTPRGMVESAFEFADICTRHDFFNFCFSMKSSNPTVMVHAYRLLAHEMLRRGTLFPLHLGVTEAGEGEDGRIKSAIGMGSLLQDGLGDTLRASLTEPPWVEIPVVSAMARMQEEKMKDLNVRKTSYYLHDMTTMRDLPSIQISSHRQYERSSEDKIKGDLSASFASSLEQANIGTSRSRGLETSADREEDRERGESRKTSSRLRKDDLHSLEISKEGRRHSREPDTEEEEEISYWSLPSFTETTRNFNDIEKRSIRWEEIPSLQEGGEKKEEKKKTIDTNEKENDRSLQTRANPRGRYLHKDGSVLVAVHPNWLSNMDDSTFYESLGYGVLQSKSSASGRGEAIPLKGLASADSIYLTSLYLSPDGSSTAPLHSSLPSTPSNLQVEKEGERSYEVGMSETDSRRPGETGASKTYSESRDKSDTFDVYTRDERFLLRPPSGGEPQEERRDRLVQILKRLQRAGVGLFAPMTDIAYLIYLREQYMKQKDISSDLTSPEVRERGTDEEEGPRALLLRRRTHAGEVVNEDSKSKKREKDQDQQVSSREKSDVLSHEEGETKKKRYDGVEDTGRVLSSEIEGEIGQLKNSLLIPGMVGVMRLKDAAAVRGKVLPQVEKEIAGIALLVDGSESEEEIDAVLDIQIYDLRAGEKETGVLEGHSDSITGLAVNGSGTSLLSNAMDHTVRLWDIQPYVKNEKRLISVLRGSTSDEVGDLKVLSLVEPYLFDRQSLSG
ncbi:4-hydroxy-3-methylbut-2-en-1-yl diphosphate synthase [Cystoisospora suis]|uniref:4-hydroxy-3-methylbut-2-en-1-yl diphosphate synthase n=1 Tax=Cystoisospora suis TaxID=483139 RepID=A0A2C6KZ52_9APIC|nr:4-hydroxy-3-methylbut-2-en-1-yl diphosphate synthase [Cystoisospora suis]